jgi:hypothetical protein
MMLARQCGSSRPALVGKHATKLANRHLIAMMLDREPNLASAIGPELECHEAVGPFESKGGLPIGDQRHPETVRSKELFSLTNDFTRGKSNRQRFRHLFLLSLYPSVDGGIHEHALD